MAGRLHISEEFAPLLARLEEIAPLLRHAAGAGETARRLTPEVVQALHRSGVFRMGIPREVGGYELTPCQMIQVIEKLSYADASTGWTVMAIQLSAGTAAAYLGKEVVQELFGNGGYTLAAGQATRPGRAVPAEGGYRLSGSWSFASGLHHVDWVHTAAVEPTGRALICILPKARATLIDHWDVLGLCATGSIDYRIDDVFVPQYCTYDITTKEPLHGGALYRIGGMNLAVLCHAGWALGVGRRALDELCALAQRRSGTPNATVDTAEFHAEYARAESDLRSARAWVMEVWAASEATLDAGDELSAEQETLARLSLNNTTWSAHRVCTTAYKWAGTAALRGGDLQRVFRDMNAGTQHITSGPAVLQGCGRQLAGLAPGAQWVFGDLADPSPGSA